jgi:hypothetical protein
MEQVEAEHVCATIGGTLVHATTCNGFRGIVADRSIRPNTGQFPDRYPQSQISFARHFGYLPLFDFAGLTVDEIIKGDSSKWLHFFCDPSPISIAIEVDRHAVSEFLVPNSEAKQRVGFDLVWIPKVEVWARHQIYLGACSGYFVAEPNHLMSLRRLDNADDVIQELNCLTRID